MAGLRQLAEHLGSPSLLGIAGKVGKSRPVSLRDLMNGVIRDAHEIRHVFVLMLENRSFDHMLGFANIIGMGLDGKVTKAADLFDVDTSILLTLGKPAEFKMSTPDPGHEFTDTLLQLCGAGSIYPPGGPYPPINHSGFELSYSATSPDHPDAVLKCFAPEQLPVLTTLAKEFALCDHWFSSMPGPTWPNRFFLHAATSGGLDRSPPGPIVVLSETVAGWHFEHATMFHRLAAYGRQWMVFEGDEFPQVKAIDDLDETHFHDISHFRKYIQDPGLSASYIFIEPNYGNDMAVIGTSDYTCGTSQHPVDDVTRGEWLIKGVYEIIRQSPHWEHSVLVITYDEHGGFFDHVAPPAAIPPGDKVGSAPFFDVNKFGFDFRQLGVRVPAVVISPLIPPNTIDHTTYDHTSVAATVERLFGMEPLTDRDRHANSFEHLFSLDLPRQDAPEFLPTPADSGYHCDDSPAIEASKMDAPVEPRLCGFVHVAFLRDYRLASPAEKPAVVAEFKSIRTNRDALQYMHKVRPKVRAQMNLPPIRTDPFVDLGINKA